MLTFRIGVSFDPLAPGERFESLDLHVHAGEPTGLETWYRTPIRSTARPGSVRVAAAGVVWGSAEYVLATLPAMPEAEVLALSEDFAPDGLPEHVEWVRLTPGLVALVEGECYPCDGATSYDVRYREL